MEPVEILYVDETVIGCDGGEGPLGHPRVFLNLGDEGEVDCPYCGRRFMLAHAVTEAERRGDAVPGGEGADGEPRSRQVKSGDPVGADNS
jgi:uncharacterized Zn-finger protein